jgi:hypothetical protein
VEPALFALPAAPILEPNKLVSRQTLGRIAELRAEIHLLERGHKVARPGTDDDGVDLIVDYRAAVQVKSRNGMTLSRGRGCWEFDVRLEKKPQGGNEVRRRSFEHIAVFICHAHEIDAWWIIPAAALPPNGVGRIRITPGGHYNQWRNAWHIFRELD